MTTRDLTQAMAAIRAMRRAACRCCLVPLLAAGLSACGETATLSVAEGSGPRPTLPVPNPTLVPTVNVAKAVGWKAGESPTAAPGTRVAAYAEGLDHPRWLYVLPNGDVLVAETNAPPKPDDGGGIKGWFMQRAMQRAGAAVPSADRITLLRDTDGDGAADLRTPLLENLHSPFGMSLVGDTLYVADTDAIVGFPYRAGDTRIAVAGARLLALPGGPINHHWTRNLLASADGAHLYASIGSNSNVGERGIEAEHERAAIWEVQLPAGNYRVFASGLRNPVGMAWDPDRGALWTVVNERDEIGSDLVPDFLTSVRDGAF
jgi:glucose/arabinose dehydrogenase